MKLILHTLHWNSLLCCCIPFSVAEPLARLYRHQSGTSFPDSARLCIQRENNLGFADYATQAYYLEETLKFIPASPDLTSSIVCFEGLGRSW